MAKRLRLPLHRYTGWAIHSITYNGDDVTNNLENDIYTVPAITANGLLSVVFEGTATYMAPMQTISSIRVYTAYQAIVVVGAEQGQTVTIYNNNGALLQGVVSQGEKVIIPVKAGAIYLVKVGEQTFKVVL
jgi:hypothetical protein